MSSEVLMSFMDLLWGFASIGMSIVAAAVILVAAGDDAMGILFVLVAMMILLLWCRAIKGIMTIRRFKQERKSMNLRVFLQLLSLSINIGNNSDDFRLFKQV
jgi:hypothetical protein